MRMRAALVALALLCAATAAGCGGAHHTTTTRTTAATPSPTPAPAAGGLRVGVVGPLDVRVSGAVAQHGTLEQVAGNPLVLVSPEAADAATVAGVAAANPTSHFALVGASSTGHHRPNLVGLVLNDKQAALLGGVVAGLVAAGQGGVDARVAWAGPEERSLAAAFAQGARDVRPGTTVLHAWSRDLPASCKEAALGAIAQGAVAVMAHAGLCADAAIAGANQQNRLGLRISDFELPSVPIGVVVQDAIAGMYRGGEDIVFDASSGAIGVRHLDPGISADIAVRARAAAQQLASGVRPSG
jgi:basic membrane lipoprotein Med (substrate-binding protein (PBP1-ABC) superfamily)